jgi:hypothetical protein
MNQNGLDTTMLKLQVHQFEHGRGMIATEDIVESDIIMAIPKHLLINVDTAYNSELGGALLQNILTGVQTVSLFLCYERFKHATSFWYSYICALPETYDIAPYYDDKDWKIMPQYMKQRAEKVLNNSKLDYTATVKWVNKYLHNPQFEEFYTYDVFKWAWCAINTRCLYMKPEFVRKNQSMQNSKLKEMSFTLAPYLDNLNHSYTSDAFVEYNYETESYVVQNKQGGKTIHAGEQVFFSYGPHDNIKLMIEYGFVVENNPHDVVLLDEHLKTWLDEVIKIAPSAKVKSLQRNLAIVKDKELSGGYSISLDEGPSWRLLTAFRIILMNYEEYMEAKENKTFNSGHKLSDRNENAIHVLIQELLKQYKRELESVKLDDSTYRRHMISTVVRGQASIIKSVT